MNCLSGPKLLYFVMGGKDASSTIGYWTLTIRALLPPEQFFSSFFHTFSMLLLYYSFAISMPFPCYFCTIPILFQYYFHAFLRIFCSTIFMLFHWWSSATKAIILKQTIHWRKMACTRGCYIYSHALKFFLTLTGTKSLFSEKTVSNESCL